VAITSIATLQSGMQPLTIANEIILSNANVNALKNTMWARRAGQAASYDTSLNGVALSNPIAGSLPFTDPNMGNAYLARLDMNHGAPSITESMWILCDRLWHNGGYTITSSSAQNSTTPTWPARDEDGSTNGKGVQLALEISSTVGAATPTVTVSYTNSAGTSGRSATNIIGTNSAAATHSVYLLSLQAGDLGVRSVQSLTLSTSWISGVINLVAFRSLAIIGNRGFNLGKMEDAIQLAMPQMFTGSVPYLIWFGNQVSGSQGPFIGGIQYAWG
jgi:hypothetical protein